MDYFEMERLMPHYGEHSDGGYEKYAGKQVLLKLAYGEECRGVLIDVSVINCGYRTVCIMVDHRNRNLMFRISAGNHLFLGNTLISLE